ncbi:hypothetical protein BH24BAC1_BH24BAC1_40180 [soil metagenome]
MKSFYLCVFILLLTCDPSFGQASNPLIGAWELIYGKYGLPDPPSERNQPDRPFQIKVFSPGHFAYVMQNEDGTFGEASAGTYRIEGDKYIETHNWHSSGEFVGATATWDFRIEGDTLYMAGPVTIVDADGKSIEGFGKMEEVRRLSVPVEWPTSSFENQTRAPQPTQPSEYTVEILTSELAHPWSLTFLPDSRMLITELSGRLRIVDPQGYLSEPLEGLPSIRTVPSGTPVSSMGLHDVVLDPEFAQNRRLYFSYFASPAGESAGFVPAERYIDWIMRSPEERAKNPIGYPRVASARLSVDERRLEDVTVILEGGHRRLMFAPDGSLFVTASTPVGLNVPIDNLPQRWGSHEGKVLRIRRDGSVPPDNPWGQQTDARPEIYAIGLRDPQGAAINSASGQLWTVEHGPRGGDEINIIHAGANYGYPVISYGRQYSGEPVGNGLTAREGLEQPVYYWTPSIAPSGMQFYTGDLFPQWKGDLFIGALAGRHLVRLVLEGDTIVAEERLLENFKYRIRDVRQGPEGALYVLTDEPEGKLLRMVPKK